MAQANVFAGCLSRKSEIDRGVFRYASLDQLPEWDAVRGLQFENLIVNNYRELIPYLHIGSSIVESAAPYRNAREDQAAAAA